MFPKSKHEIPFVSTEQMREVDRLMVEKYGITLLQMMENAGRNLARFTVKWMQKIGMQAKLILGLAGRGGNGGGVLAAVRHLHNWGYPVSVVLSHTQEEYNGVPARQLSICQAMHIPVSENAPSSLPSQSIILDGLIGYSLKGYPSGKAAWLIDWTNKQSGSVISLDNPSGLDTSKGAIYSPVVKADATLTLALPKTGFLKSNAENYIGELYLADIGVPPSLYQENTLRLEVPQIFHESEIVRIW